MPDMRTAEEKEAVAQDEMSELDALWEKVLNQSPPDIVASGNPKGWAAGTNTTD